MRASILIPNLFRVEILELRGQMMNVLKGLDEKHCHCPYGAAGKEAGPHP